MYTPLKRDIIQFKRDHISLYKKILSDYAPITDRWVAVDMHLNDIPPPECDVCGIRLRVSKSMPSRCSQHINTSDTYTYERFLAEQVYSDNMVEQWQGTLSKSQTISVCCPVHGKYSQSVGNALFRNCQKCYASNDRQLKHTPDEWISAAIQVHGDKYDYSSSVYTGVQHNIAIICKTHGAFMQRPNVHLSGHGCKKCANVLSSENLRHSQEKVIEIANKVHDSKYDYGEVQYTSMSEKIHITCPIHGKFMQRPKDHLYNVNGCPQCGFQITSHSNRSKGEIALCDNIRGLGVNVLSSYRALGFEIDIFLPDHNIGIEYNGLYWHAEISSGKTKNYHYDKWRACKDAGIDLYTVYDCDYQNPRTREIIHNKFKYLSHATHKVVGARKCTILEVENSDEFFLLDSNHMQGKLHSRSGSLGAYYAGELVAVMNWVVRKSYLDITRFCTQSHNTSYPGLFSKLLKAVLAKTHFSGTIVSFSNNDHSNGNVYLQSGFTAVKTLGPAYWYTKYKVRENRQKYMKSKIAKQFNTDMSSKTEWQAMQELGFDRIWDSGKIKWEMETEHER